MTYVLVKFSDNWADEMDIAGFKVMTQEAWDETVALVHKWFETNEYYTVSFGTNEENEYYSAENLLDCFEVTPLDVIGHTVLYHLFSKPYGEHDIEFGEFPFNNFSTLYDLDDGDENLQDE